MVNYNRIITALIGFLFILSGIILISYAYIKINNIYVPLAILTLIAWLSLSKMSFLENFTKRDPKTAICGMCSLESLCDLREKGKAEACSIFSPNIDTKLKESPS